uniref:Uncharacterized protein n=1 Tax=Octopus bimaculoides TaxID=37653 RepID=A0A0L8I145_OCTBM
MVIHKEISDRPALTRTFTTTKTLATATNHCGPRRNLFLKGLLSTLYEQTLLCRNLLAKRKLLFLLQRQHFHGYSVYKYSDIAIVRWPSLLYKIVFNCSASYSLTSSPSHYNHSS